MGYALPATVRFANNDSDRLTHREKVVVGNGVTEVHDVIVKGKADLELQQRPFVAAPILRDPIQITVARVAILREYMNIFELEQRTPPNLLKPNM
jgi:hypothetical protein